MSQIINKNTNIEEILQLLKNNEFENKYQSYISYKKYGGYLIKSKVNKEEKIFIFKKPKNLKIYDETKEYNFKVLTSLEINSYAESIDIEPNLLFIKSIKLKYITQLDNLYFNLKLGNYELEKKKNQELPFLKFKDALEEDDDYTPMEYSKYFYEYFIHEDKNKKDRKIVYELTEARKIIALNLNNLEYNDELKTFKFTGPTSIGKSFTLFIFCHISYNFIYVNLKALNDKDLYNSYCLLISELERLDKVDEKSFNELIGESFKHNRSILDLLLNIMKYLQKIEDIKFVFVFDQFKYKYIKQGFLEAINNFKNIKYVLCSSINDKKMREFCLESWKQVGKNVMKLNVENQKYYLYFSSIYEFKNEKRGSNNIIFEQLGFIPKYIMLYKTTKNKSEFFADIRNHITKKIDEFCGNSKINKAELLINLKYIIIKTEYHLNQLEEIIKFCLLKYFVVKFNEYGFNIEPMFPFMIDIITIKFTKDECDDYFKKELYKLNPIESESVKGDYFEESVKFGLQELELPRKYEEIYTVDKIASMEQLILDKNYYNILSKEYIERSKEFEKERKIQAQNPIINNYNIIESEEENKKERGEEEENEDDENDDNSEEKKEEDSEKKNDNDSNEKVKENKKNKEIEIKKERDKQNKNLTRNEKLKILLENFSINIKDDENKEKNYEGIDKESIVLSKDIEYYRRREIYNQLKKKNYTEIKQKIQFTGKEILLIDQISSYGKALDYAFLYGEKNYKIFIGFQMKCYFDNSILSDNAIDKLKIKDNCKKILVNSMKLFNCKIMKWHYFLIFYCNSKTPNENINIKNLNNCKMKGIAYFFYDPILKKFFDSNIPQERKEIKALQLTEESDLDNNRFNIKNILLGQDKILLNNGSIPIGGNLIEMKESFIRDFKELCKDKTNPNLQNILSQIKINMNIKYEILFKMKLPIAKGYIAPPDEKHILLYKKKDCNEYLAIMQNSGKVEFFDIFHQNKSKYFCSLLDEEHKYYYCLSINKRRRIAQKSEYNQNNKRNINEEKILFNFKP